MDEKTGNLGLNAELWTTYLDVSRRRLERLHQTSARAATHNVSYKARQGRRQKIEKNFPSAPQKTQIDIKLYEKDTQGVQGRLSCRPIRPDHGCPFATDRSLMFLGAFKGD